jgi:hypothetical protein
MDLIWTIALLLIIGWLFGWILFPVVGGLIHILLIIAVIMILYRLITGKRL